MFHRRFILITCLPLLVLATALPVQGQWRLDVESGMVSCRSNDIQVPKSYGTLFSLTDDLAADARIFFRIRFGVRLGERHHISLFAAPLTLKARGQVDKDILFNQENFPAGTPLDASYTFNSYRATYRFDIVRRSNWIVGLGFTAKIRDAAIDVQGGGRSSQKTNIGFVPLLNFWVQWRFAPRWSLLCEGDALASPGGQGRAEDIFLGGMYQASEAIRLKAGYRLLEGGADVDEVYNFAWLDFLVIGVVLTF